MSSAASLLGLVESVDTDEEYRAEAERCLELLYQKVKSIWSGKETSTNNPGVEFATRGTAGYKSMMVEFDGSTLPGFKHPLKIVVMISPRYGAEGSLVVDDNTGEVKRLEIRIKGPSRESLRAAFIHEFIHSLDVERIKSKSKTPGDYVRLMRKWTDHHPKTEQEWADYVGSDVEYNAFYQEAVSVWTSLFRMAVKKYGLQKAVALYGVDATFPIFIKSFFLYVLDKVPQLDSLEGERLHRFKKRLSGFYQKVKADPKAFARGAKK